MTDFVIIPNNPPAPPPSRQEVPPPPPPRPELQTTSRSEANSLTPVPPLPSFRELGSNLLPLRQAPPLPPPPLQPEERATTTQNQASSSRQAPLPPPPLRELGLSSENQRRFLQQTPNAPLALRGFVSGPLQAIMQGNAPASLVLESDPPYNPYDPRRSDTHHKSSRFIEKQSAT